MSPESAPPTGMARASPALGQALIFQHRSRQNPAQIEPTKFPAGGALPASPSRIPVLSRLDGPCDAPRRTDPAATASWRIARPGRLTDPWPNAVRFDQAVRKYLTCRLAENPASPQEQPWRRVLLSERPERSPHNCRRQCERLSPPLPDRTAPVPATAAARPVPS